LIANELCAIKKVEGTMTFQVLDTKGECVGFYKDGEVLYNQFIEGLDRTWNYASILRGKDIQYAEIYANGKSISECCPEIYKEDWERVNKKLKAFFSSFLESKVSLQENCIFDLIPERYLKEYYDVKCKITDHVFETHQKPPEYEFFKRFGELIADVSSRELKLDLGWLSEKLWDVQAKRLWDKIQQGQRSIEYNMFGSVTGRLTATENSFPILNLNKDLRNVIKPTNDWLVEIDLNAAELRTAIALLNKEQIEGDLHEWSAKNIFNGELNRSEAKQTATSWLYNSQNKLALKYDKQLNEFYNKPALKAMYWIDGVVHTPFQRHIPADDHHAISYLNQSTLIDLLHRQIIKVDDLLKGKKTFIPFLVHDSFVLDLDEEEKQLLPEIIRTISDTKWGKFPVNVKIGSDYGNMKKVKLKV
jgi:hypothetical protein